MIEPTVCSGNLPDILGIVKLQGVPYPSLPERERPRRVGLYFSSWRIRAGIKSI